MSEAPAGGSPPPVAQERGAQENPSSGGQSGEEAEDAVVEAAAVLVEPATEAASTHRPAARAILEGNTDGMKANVFQCHGENTDKQQFTKTVGVLEQHINKTFTYPEDIALICRTFTIVQPVQPKNLEEKKVLDTWAKR